MTPPLINEALPGFFRDADLASLRGQKRTIRWNAVRLAGATLATVGGALSWKIGMLELWGVFALLGFAVALASEIVLAAQRPERDWYAGRALAESAKTLAWRYSVAADPFFDGMPLSEARRIMRERLEEVAAKGKDRIVLASDDMDITGEMTQIRALPFEQRRQIYLTSRITDQRDWYALNAMRNRKNARLLRTLLILAEVAAVALAAGRAFGAWNLDISGLLASLVAGGAAWLGLKQYSSLASAYSVATAELNLSYSQLRHTDAKHWSEAVADAEEAISREHTMWLASRSGKP